MPPKKRHYHQGHFTPTHPEKYAGDVRTIVYRSSWERTAMRFFDTHPEIVQWSSEEIVIPYRCQTDGQIHRYFPDFLITTQTASGKQHTFLIEVKPFKETRPPLKRKRKTKSYVTEVLTWTKNQSKWEAAKAYCATKGWHFMFLTERELEGNSKIPRS